MRRFQTQDTHKELEKMIRAPITMEVTAGIKRRTLYAIGVFPETPALSIPVFALVMQLARVSASFRQGMTIVISKRAELNGLGPGVREKSAEYSAPSQGGKQYRWQIRRPVAPFERAP